MHENEITKRPARWTDCVKIAAGELTGTQKLVLNLLPRVVKTAFDFPQSPTNLKGVSYVALFEIDRAAWITTDEDGKALLAFEFPAAILEEIVAEDAILASFRDNGNGNIESRYHVDFDVKKADPTAPSLREFIKVMMFIESKRSAGAAMIFKERFRQIQAEGFTAEHDDAFIHGELKDAAIAYAMATEEAKLDIAEGFFPETWGKEWWKPSTIPIRNLVISGALIAAEIDRRLRQEQKGGEKNADR